MSTNVYCYVRNPQIQLHSMEYTKKSTRNLKYNNVEMDDTLKNSKMI